MAQNNPIGISLISIFVGVALLMTTIILLFCQVIRKKISLDFFFFFLFNLNFLTLKGKIYYACPGLQQSSERLEIFQVIPSYNDSQNSQVDLFSSINNIYDHGKVKKMKQCGNGFLVIGEFNYIGDEISINSAFWNGLLFILFSFLFLMI